ncbi:caspase domain-containing protein [Mycena filopes]|nr:caspase domain-containing protein [Mycena filopes]
MRAMLIDTWKYTESQITVLVDDGVDSHPQPTRVNILKAIADFVSDVRDGDHLFFHYAGHSTQVDSTTEQDGKDECLVPSDGDANKIVNEVLHARLIKPLPAGSQLVALLDTSRGGSLLGLKHFPSNRVFGPWMREGDKNSGDILTHRGAGVKADVICLASCRDSQQAWEGPGGVSMSSLFVGLMREDPNRFLNEVMLHISHAAYSLSLVRHARSKEYKGILEAYVARRIAYIRQSASVSVFRDRAPSLATTLNPTIRAAKSAAVKLKLVTGRHGVVPGLRRTLTRDVEELDKSNFQNPELASPQPLDMNRRLRL